MCNHRLISCCIVKAASLKDGGGGGVNASLYPPLKEALMPNVVLIMNLITISLIKVVKKMSLYKIQRILLKYLNPVILHYKKPIQYMKTTCHCLLMFSSLDKTYRHSLNSYSLWESRRRHHYIDDITYQVVLHYSITRSGIGH